MSLDQNLFTLVVTPNKDDPNVVDLVDPAGTIHYRKQRIAGPVYTAEVYDFMSESLLATATAPSVTSKTKSIILCNPTQTVELKFSGTLTFRWSFKWEEHEFEWKREQCFLIRKPDPPVLVAITKEPTGRLKTSTIQILDYNINRFEVEDKKGLEIVMLTALLTFQDSNEAHHTKEPSRGGSTSPAALQAVPSPPIALSPPLLPPKPAPKSGVDRIAEMQAMRNELNEVVIEHEGRVEDYAAYSWNLLQDDTMLFMMVRSLGKEQVQKAVLVAEEIKRLHHKAGTQGELHQYVSTFDDAPKGPKRINLDDNKGNKSLYAPPENIRIHLSKIPLPELQPKARSRMSSSYEKPPMDSPIPPSPGGLSKKEEKAREKEEKAREKELEKLAKERAKEKKKKKKGKNSPPPSPPNGSSSSSKLAKPSGGSHSRSPSHVHSYQSHPYQPSPSPSQLNNPGIYVAPPPPRPHITPHYSTTLAPPGALQSRNSVFYPQPQPPSPQNQTPAGSMSGFLNNMLNRH